MRGTVHLAVTQQNSCSHTPSINKTKLGAQAHARYFLVDDIYEPLHEGVQRELHLTADLLRSVLTWSPF